MRRADPGRQGGPARRAAAGPQKQPPPRPPATITVQYATARAGTPHPQRIRAWAETVLAAERRPGGVCIRLVGAVEGTRLNRRYRGRAAATNVLAFPGPPAAAGGCWLGDVVVCAPVARREAREQGKAPDDHFAHLVVHGVLHLLGYDHIDPADAERMERRERKLLAACAIPDPYRAVRREAPPGGVRLQSKSASGTRSR